VLILVDIYFVTYIQWSYVADSGHICNKPTGQTAITFCLTYRHYSLP